MSSIGRQQGMVVSTLREMRYRVIAELGRGGMATVYLALSEGPAGFSKLVVLKCIRPELAIDDNFLAMFLDEARLAARLNHPNIVQTNEIIESSGAPVIVMEYLEGQPFSSILRRGYEPRRAMPRALQLHVLVEVLRGLHYAHEVTDFDGTPFGLVHRDITPQNIFVTYDGQVKILDFGIAKSTWAQHETHTGVVKGKIRYMAREQLLGDVVDRRADVFSIGVILWNVLMGRPLWEAQTDAEVAQSILSGQFPSALEAAKQFSPEAYAMLTKALANDRERRYPTAQALELDLSKLIQDSGERPNATALSQCVSKLFEEERERSQTLIGKGIREANLAAGTGNHPVVFPSRFPPHRLPAINREPDGSQPPLISYARDAFRPKRGTNPWLLTSALLVFSASLALIGYLVPGRSSFTASVHHALPPSAALAEAAPSLLSIAPVVPSGFVQLSAHPHDANLFLDGTPLNRNPYRDTLRPDRQSHVLRAEKAGYVSKEEPFVANQEMTVNVVLERIRPAPIAPTQANLAQTSTIRHSRASQGSEPDPGF